MDLDFRKLLGMGEDSQDLPPTPLRPDYVPTQSPPPINPVVRDAILKKYQPAAVSEDDSDDVEDSAPVVKGPSEFDTFSAKYGDDSRKKAVADAESKKSGLGWLQFASGLGDAIAGRSQEGTNQNFDAIRKNIDDKTVGAFDKQRASAVQDIATKKSFEGSDPNSAKSKVVQQTIQKLWGDKFTPDQIAKITADDADLVYKPMELKSKLDEQHDNNLMKHEMLRQGQQDRSDKKTDGELIKLQTMAESARLSPAVGQAEKDLYAASKVKTLVNMYSDPNKMNDNMVKLLVQDVAKIASGGQPTQHELEGMQPNTWTGKMASAWQSVSNHPTPANAAAFIKQYTDYSSALAHDAQKVIIDKYGRVLDPYQNKYKDNQTYQAIRGKYIDRFKNEEPSGGKITVTNGKETLQIDPSDLAHAKADGYREQ
jgi:hypothetical protein